jgi:hypothetical protein
MSNIECQTTVTTLCTLFRWISDFKPPVRSLKQIFSFVCFNECSLPLYWGICLIFILIRYNRSVSLPSTLAELHLKESKTTQCNANYAWLMTSRCRQCVLWTDKLKQWECMKCRVCLRTPGCLPCLSQDTRLSRSAASTCNLTSLFFLYGLRNVLSLDGGSAYLWKS